MKLHDIDRTDGDLVGEGKASTSKYNEEKEQEEILTNAVKKVRSVWRDMVKQAYLDNASEIMLHSHKSENGDIIKINIPYVEFNLEIFWKIRYMMFIMQPYINWFYAFGNRKNDCQTLVCRRTFD